MTNDPADDREFEAHRERLRAVAYRMTGQVADADDVVQEAWLRWSSAPRDDVRDVRAFLVTMTSRLALDRLRRVAARREAYVGPWLPEPMRTEGDPATLVERAESVAFGLLVVLEALSPLERVVFVLRESFGYSHAEIAAMLERSDAAVRQVYRRAREHVRASERRFTGDIDVARHAADRFLEAAATGELGPFLALLAPDVELVADGGGRVRAPLRPVTGVAAVGRFLAAVRDRAGATSEVRPATLNGAPGIVVTAFGLPAAALLFATADGAVTRIFLVGNPDKLARLGDVTPD